jgi:hypothetical protein
MMKQKDQICFPRRQSVEAQPGSAEKLTPDFVSAFALRATAHKTLYPGEKGKIIILDSVTLVG